MIQTNLSQVFSYTFVFLFGMLIGALGEMLWNGRFHKNQENDDNSPFQYLNQPLPPNEIQNPNVIQDSLAVSEIGNNQESAPEAKTLQQTTIEVRPLPPIRRQARKFTRPLPMVEQMDEILRDLQTLSNRTGPIIRLLDDGHQNVLIKIGDLTYNGIDTVPDPQAVALIRQAAADWEKLYTK
jgi:hypothetical protein